MHIRNRWSTIRCSTSIIVKIGLYFFSGVLFWCLGHFIELITESLGIFNAYELDFESYSKLAIYFEVVVLAPIIETLIFQVVIIESIYRYRKNSRVLAILFSALVFGLAHQYSLEYVIATFFLGLYLGMIYTEFKKISFKEAFLITFITHMISNFIEITYRIILQRV